MCVVRRAQCWGSGTGLSEADWRYGVKEEFQIARKLAVWCCRCEGSVSGVSDSDKRSHLWTRSGGGAGDEGRVSGMWNQKPCRMERELDAPVNIKCQPGGMSFIPWNRAEVVKERRSMPQSVPGGRSRSRMAGLVVSGGGKTIAMAIFPRVYLWE